MWQWQERRGLHLAVVQLRPYVWQAITLNSAVDSAEWKKRYASLIINHISGCTWCRAYVQPTHMCCVIAWTTSHYSSVLSIPSLLYSFINDSTNILQLISMTDYTAGRWTREEHHTFIKGLEMYGKGWKKIASLIKTRTVVQIRTHAQKYFLKLTKARQSGDANVSTDGKASGTGGRKVRYDVIRCVRRWAIGWSVCDSEGAWQQLSVTDLLV